MGTKVVMENSKQALHPTTPLKFSEMKIVMTAADGTEYSIDLSTEITRTSEMLQMLDYINDKINFLNGIDSKYLGYLYGGYKSGNSIDHIQRYNTMTESSKDIYTTGKKVAYVPGITTRDAGYFTWQDSDGTWYWSKFDFDTEELGATISSTLPTRVQVSAYNMGIGNKALVSAGKAQGGASTFQPQTHVSKTWTFDASAETFTEIAADTLNNIQHTTRQAINNNTAAFMVTWPVGDSYHYIFEWETNTISTDTAHVKTKDQIATGLSKDKQIAYWVDRTTLKKLKIDGKTILALESMTYPFKPHYGESHTLQNYRSGYVMAGYDDNIGDYGGGQHGYASKIDWISETATRLPNLAFPQSSGEMVQR